MAYHEQRRYKHEKKARLLTFWVDDRVIAVVEGRRKLQPPLKLEAGREETLHCTLLPPPSIPELMLEIRWN
jgi:hypothetical protein